MTLPKIYGIIILANPDYNGIHNGMSLMTHRTTSEVDEKTAQRLKRLSAKWHVSQAEVVRRSLEQAESADTPVQKDPVALLQRLHAAGGGLAAEEAAAYMEQVWEDRK